MAITTTNARYEGFIFDGENSRDYGVYVTDVEVFGAPVRNVEMISIPGRNGSFALDKGSYENIQVTYKCAMGCESQADFNAGISAFRNMLASRIGYKRLEDEINTDEYRMACFRGGISVPTLNKETATFDVVFDCQPQRYLKAGETAVSVASGGAIENPTLYDAHPMLQVWGYGGLALDGAELNINSTAVGRVDLAGAYVGTATTNTERTTIDGVSKLNTGDRIYLESPYFDIYITGDDVPETTPVFNVSSDDGWHAHDKAYGYIYGERAIYFRLKPIGVDSFRFAKGTAETQAANITVTIQATQTTFTFRLAIRYQDNAFYFSVTNVSSGATVYFRTNYAEIYGISSKSALGEPLYFDLDIGEAYKIEDGEVVSVNNAVTIPAKLPVLVPGANAVEYDSTITQFKIVPRWWQL